MLSPNFSALRHHSKSDGDSSSEAESIDGLNEDGSSGPVYSPSCIPAYNTSPPLNENWSRERAKDDTLIEFFSGWSIAHASFHRRFVAITAFADRAYSKWGHVSQTGKMSSFAQNSRRLRFRVRTNSCKGKALNASRSHKSTLRNAEKMSICCTYDFSSDMEFLEPVGPGKGSEYSV